MNAIELNNLTKRYGSFTLDHITLSLPSGSILGLVGENGAGKSTTIHLLTGAIAPDEGSVSILGMDNRSSGFSALKNDIGVVLDEAYFPEVLTPAHVASIMRDTYRNWNDDVFRQFLKRFALAENKAFRDFSRGMKMKLAISVALSHAPKLLILDEAASGLDPMTRDELLDLFNDFTRDENHSILLSSHIVSDLEKICDYIAFLHKGKLLLFEEKDRLLEEYALAKLSASEAAALPSQAVAARKKTAYGVDVLVRTSLVSHSLRLERTSLEDVILFLSKGENQNESAN